MNRYRIAIYMRLSKEDDQNKEESNSISMQRILLKKYVAESFSNYELMEFADDGYTGTNFNRPGMQSLLKMVRNFELDCIVVKDFSRFARDYIELGSYLEQIFPFMGVRFISVNDHYDSKADKGSMADLDINFRNLLYDLYSKDLSQKVRASLAVKKAKGEYISAGCPFGYGKAPDDRHMLLIEKAEAEIVQRIFRLTLQGCTSVQIARQFNEEKVKTPVEFKLERGETTRAPKGGIFLWTPSMICQILRNRIYVGDIVYGKYEKDFVGGKNHIKPRKEWSICYNHHEPIIKREVFEQVEAKRGKKQNAQGQKSHPFVGKAVCGCCKRNLRYRHGQNPYFCCHQRYFNAMEGCVEKVNAAYLEEYVLFMIQQKRLKDGEIEPLAPKSAKLLKNLSERYIENIIIYDERNIKIQWRSDTKEAAVILHSGDIFHTFP